MTITSEGKQFRNENFYNIVLGTDYYIDPRNVITLSANYAYEIESQPSLNTFSSDSNGLRAEWERTEITEATNPKYRYELQYKRDFNDHKEHTLLFSALGNFFGKTQSSDFSNKVFNGSPNLPEIQQTKTSFQEAKHTFKLDYTKPFSEKWMLELGGQYVINDVSNDYEVRDWLDNILGSG